MLAGAAGGLIALVLAATSPLYVHQSALAQADGPSVAVSMIAVALALLAVRWNRRRGIACAALAGIMLAFAIGIKLLGAVTVIPVTMVSLGAPRGPVRLLATTAAGSLLGLLIVMLPAVASPATAFDDLVLAHLRAGQAAQQSLGANLHTLFL